MYRSVDAIARRTRLQQRRREQLLPPLASSSWSRIEAVVPAVPDSTPVEAMSSLSLSDEMRAVFQEADDLINEVLPSSSEPKHGESLSSSSKCYDDEIQAVLREANELLTDYGISDHELDDEYNNATLEAMVADINKQYKKVMKETILLRRSSRRALRSSYQQSDRPTYQIMTRARRALVFDNNRDVCVN
nr:hypothetical protein Mb_orf5 [Mamestra brassicae multiple nucleopolyhedrovirus]